MIVSNRRQCKISSSKKESAKEFAVVCLYKVCILEGGGGGNEFKVVTYSDTESSEVLEKTPISSFGLRKRIVKLFNLLMT
jgi:hypothetical protein